MRKRIFWVELLDELATAKVTQNEIAARVKSSQPAISRLAKGATEEPPHSVGEALIGLHLAICGGDQHQTLLARNEEAEPVPPHPMRRATDHPHPLRRSTDKLPGAAAVAGEG